MKLKEVRNLSNEELVSRLNDTREELMNLRFQISTGSLTDYTRLRQTRRTIARMLTVIRERELGIEEGEA
jgi:large subunit ribosomal protein L29